MGRLIRMGVLERRLFQPKRLPWSRLFFLLGMLLIGSTYQHLRNWGGLPTLGEAVSVRHRVKLASQDLSDGQMVTMSRGLSGRTSNTEGQVLVPPTTVSRQEAELSRPMANTPTQPRRTVTITPTIPLNIYIPSVAGTERVKEKAPTPPRRGLRHDTVTASRQTGQNSTPTPPRAERKNHNRTQNREKGEKQSAPPPAQTADNDASFLSVTLKRSRVITPTTAARGGRTMAPFNRMGTNAPRRTVEGNTPTLFKGLVDNIPIFLTRERETNILTSPRTVEENRPPTHRGVRNTSTTKPWWLVGKDHVTTAPRAAQEHTPAISEGPSETSSSAAETEASTAPQRDSPPSTSAPMARMPTATFQRPVKKPHPAPSPSVTPRVRATPTPQVHPCVVVMPGPAVFTSSSPSSTTEGPSPSPSLLPSHDSDQHPKAEYPSDLFSVQERRQGWVVLHVFGMMYVFVALAIVCDEFFVPALGVITDKLQISEDVAGATFMAAGGSAPELFTSLIGVFISHSNVGIGTIVGSAVFNILFVIGTCALFSQEILHLTWWPLFRDVSFYIFDLMMLILFFLDSLIAWWESLLLLLAYACYVLTMKWNKQLELWVKEQLSRGPLVKVVALGDINKPAGGAVAVDKPQEPKKLKLPSVLTRGSSSASLHNSIIRTTIYQLMLQSLDPLGTASPSMDKEESLHQEATAKPQAKAESKREEEEPAELPAVTVTPAPAPDSEGDQEEDADSQEGHVAQAQSTGETPCGELEAAGEGEMEAERSEADCEGEGDIQADGGDRKDDRGETGGQESTAESQGDEKATGGEEESDSEDGEEEEEEEEEEEGEEEEEEPLSLEWPESRQKQAIYLFLLPIVLPLWLTVPDVRRLESRKFFVLTFLGSITWIALFSYLMVWWAHQVGETIGISEEMMGLTILAAGTSIPDLITSVIVARKGLGDMAVSSSVGSNIFDITVGLPVPWLLFSLTNGFLPVPVSSNGLFCAIVLLFLMLLFVITSIALCRWRMNKMLGFTMFVLYFIFLITSVMLEDRIISCPVSV
ncbi:sodium/potassium/calcium exchanger 1 isoform X2 [Tenrec ecaudatus]|uniref:sodium/potassium/calcium exchanger 1 isoform X2 n=1 Tax=Tenrec ecaudatus TaxID=94439 RepID=UPI003F595C68